MIVADFCRAVRQRLAQGCAHGQPVRKCDQVAIEIPNPQFHFQRRRAHLVASRKRLHPQGAAWRAEQMQTIDSNRDVNAVLIAVR
jgi:hypothetical protein